jgi:hypothetical protein
MRTRLILIGSAVALAAIFWWLGFHARPQQVAGSVSGQATPARVVPLPATAGETLADAAPTAIYAHNLLLHKGPSFRIYILWLRGQMLRTESARNPSFDDVNSFLLDIQKGVIHVSLKDLAQFLNAGTVPNTPLTHVSLTESKGQVQLHGTAHKLIPLPVELAGTLSVTSDNHVHFHVEHLGLFKVPLKGLLGGFDITLADLVRSNTPGVQIAGNDVIFDTEVLLPAPHIRGALTGVSLVTDKEGTAIEATYGNAKSDPTHEQQWHNFLQLSDGTLDFGKLTMHHVDLIMVDASKDPWFDLDLSNYQAQLVNGITRMTPQAGLQIFMPDLDDMPPQKAKQFITMEWLKHRSLPPPPDIPYK